MKVLIYILIVLIVALVGYGIYLGFWPPNLHGVGADL
jgi:hypothetical protein